MVRPSTARSACPMADACDRLAVARTPSLPDIHRVEQRSSASDAFAAYRGIKFSVLKRTDEASSRVVTRREHPAPMERPTGLDP